MRSQDFADVYQRECQALTRFAATIVGPDKADDVVANAVVSVMRRVLDSPDERTPANADELRPYLYRSVANAGAKEWRSIGRRERREALAARRQPTDSATPSPAAEATPDEAIRSALSDLSPRQRAVIHLTYWEDLTPSATAERLGVSQGSVRRHLARARQKLRTALAEEFGSDIELEADDPEAALGGAQ